MDIQELKKLLKSSTSVLIMDNGNPDLIVMEYKAYQRLAGVGNGASPVHAHEKPVSSEPAARAREAEVLEKLNREILALKEQIRLEEERSADLRPVFDRTVDTPVDF